uniref:Ubiquitin-like domain-containing protein n=1 Tax=Alexandrium monilatum TaxID=311494 RepID=A0A7S4VTF0_9DINO|mmetsp:Transcript_27993/g.83674  ORF Transcript_27993/g.83674 Transcript_27993/m.83674 type:complete len:169 (+) Transcript_27993:46-552(+)
MGRALRVVGGLTGDVLCTVDAGPSLTVHGLKEAVEREAGIPFLTQLLLAGDQRLHDSDVLTEALDARDCAGPAVVTLLRLDPAKVSALELARRGGPLSTLDEAYSLDRDVVLAAVARNGYALGWAAPRFRSDREVVLAATRSWCGALQLAAKELQRDPELLRAAGARR